MITGKEQIHPTTDSNYISSDPYPTVGVFGGITLKQHMVIEFTKAYIYGLYSDENMFSQTRDILKANGKSIGEGLAKMAIEQADEVIKQMNDEK